MSKLTKNMDIVLQQGPELIEFYRNNPCIAAYELLGADLAPVQRVVFEAMWFKPYVLAVASRGYGKSYLSGLLATLLTLLYPGYRVGLIAPSFRQCLIISDTYSTFWTSDGLKVANDFYDSIKCNSTYIQSLNTSNLVINKWKNSSRPCIKIQTDRGFAFGGTLDHRVLTFNKNMDFVFEELHNVNNTTYLVIKKGFNLYGTETILPYTFTKGSHRDKICKLPTTLTEDFAYWMGLVIGDGTIEYNEYTGKYRVCFYSSDEKLTNSFKDIGSRLFGIEPWKDFNRHGNICSCFSNKQVILFLLSCGLSTNNAEEKHIPDVICKAPKMYITSFISGLLDTDGNVSQFTDSKYRWVSIGFTSSSKRLIEEYKAILLNIGIMSSTSVDNRYKEHYIDNHIIRKNYPSYNVTISGFDDLKIFYKNIKFNLHRKQKIIETYIKNKSCKISNTNKLPYSAPYYKELLLLLNTVYKELLTEKELYIVRMGIRCSNKNKSQSITYAKLMQILSLYSKYKIYHKLVNKFYSIINLNVSFVKPLKFSSLNSETIDIEVNNESCYFSSGFVNHNSKMVFAEVEKIYSQSPILRSATEKRPIRGSDTCYLKYKSVSGYNGSFIEALPLGTDGAKIRGSRFYCILIDEFAQVPSKIIETVLAPMSITKLDPMKKVRELERRKALIEAGLASEDDFEEDSVNKMIGTSSGYYKFNHMYKRMREYWNQIDEGSTDHVVFQVPYTALPDGFLDPKNIENAERVMSSHEFAMEYLAAMVSDSEGFFKASVLDKCTTTDFVLELSGDKESNYIIGIDPNQGGKAKCGVVIIKLGKPNKIVRVLALDGKTTQDITTSLQDLCNSYNVTRIFMDRGGGGKAVSDLLAEGYNGVDPILNRNDKETLQTKGRRILDLVTPSTSWISDANFSTLSLFEDSNLMFPQEPLNAVEEKSQEVFYSNYALIEELKRQCLNIVVTQTTGGSLHFDTPKKGQNKDLYSALVLAGYGVKALEHELLDDTSTSSIHVTGGLVRGRSQGAWSNISSSTSSSVFLSKAIPKKKLK